MKDRPVTGRFMTAGLPFIHQRSPVYENHACEVMCDIFAITGA